MRYKQAPGPPVAVGQAVIFLIQRGNNVFTGAGDGNNKVFEGLAVFALCLERFKDTRLAGVRRNVEEDSGLAGAVASVPATSSNK